MTVRWEPVGSGADLAAWAVGEGPVLLAAHGIEDGWRNWTPVAERLADRYRIVALDLPWRAGNDYTWRAGGTPGTWLARAVELAGEPAHALLGHSFGANAALELLAAGHRASAAVLVSPFYRPHGMVDDALRAQSRVALRTTIRTGLRLGLGDRAVEEDVLDLMERGLLDRLMPTVFPVFFDYFATSGDLPLSDVDVPVLVTAGAGDPALTADRAAALAAAMPAATVRRHEHYTHFCHLEQAGEVAAEVTGFLSTHSLTNTGGPAR